MASVSEDFYNHQNGWWLDDSTVVIPPEYPRWGGFTKLHDESLKNQIALLKEIADAKDPTPDEQRLRKVYNASIQRFRDWEEGKSDYSTLAAELNTLGTSVCVTEGKEDEWAGALARYMARCQRLGIGSPFSFDKEGNLEDSDNVVLDLSPTGLSLPSRSYYLDAKFEENRSQYREHLTAVATLLEGEGIQLQDDFAARVMRFETKMAMLRMTQAQGRAFDQYYTITALDRLTSGINELKHLSDKDANYATHTVAESDPAYALLTSTDATCTEADITAAQSFLDVLCGELELREVMSANFLQNYGREDADAELRMMVFDGDYFRRIFKLLLLSCNSNRSDIVAYLQYKVIRSASSYCSKELDEAFFDFFSRKLGGQQQQQSSEKRSTNLVNSWLDELLGKVYVSRFFSEQDKTTVRNMISVVLDVMQVSIRNNDWLTQPTKDKALEKLAKFIVKIGYPDKWKDFSSLIFEDGDTLFTMRQKVYALDHKVEFLEKLNSVKDKAKWEMTPQTVNAYFHPLNNEIVFPAAILQPPFYTKDVADIKHPLGDTPTTTPGLLSATNFGAIGAVIAHEITHGYDDQGRKFDSNGNVNDWWQQEDADLFSVKTKLMAAQADQWAYVQAAKPAEGKEAEQKEAEQKEAEQKETVHRMNAQLTMGENLADLGGMSLAVQALEREMKEQNASPEQRRHQLQAFFRSWANVWKIKQSEAYTIQALATDPHAPCSFRANLCKNIDCFYEAFDISEEGAMFLAPEQRVRMW